MNLEDWAVHGIYTMPQNQKRPFQALDNILEGIKAVVLDIEGTITPISFVKVRIRLHTHLQFAMPGPGSGIFYFE